MERLSTVSLEQLPIIEGVGVEGDQDIRQRVAATALHLAGVSMEFARVERVPRYADSRHESDVEHSFMLSMIASELAVALYPQLDPGLVHQYGGVHDLIELITDDVATFSISAEELAAKEKAEHDALAGLVASLPPYTGRLLMAYEAQADKESRFVRAVDKLMPVLVDILGDGITMLKVDYGVHDSDALLQSHIALHARIRAKYGEFPEIVDAQALLFELFEEEAELAFANLNA
ncbi:MAG: HD domain-containing protein [Candidatus Microsaccharimonas sp.]